MFLFRELNYRFGPFCEKKEFSGDEHDILKNQADQSKPTKSKVVGRRWGIRFGKIQINIPKELQKVIYDQFALLRGQGRFEHLLNRL